MVIVSRGRQPWWWFKYRSKFRQQSHHRFWSANEGLCNSPIVTSTTDPGRKLDDNTCSKTKEFLYKINIHFCIQWTFIGLRRANQCIPIIKSYAAISKTWKSTMNIQCWTNQVPPNNCREHWMRPPLATCTTARQGILVTPSRHKAIWGHKKECELPELIH